jgi:hypothetical protein
MRRIYMKRNRRLVESMLGGGSSIISRPSLRHTIKEEEETRDRYLMRSIYVLFARASTD